MALFAHECTGCEVAGAAAAIANQFRSGGGHGCELTPLFYAKLKSALCGLNLVGRLQRIIEWTKNL